MPASHDLRYGCLQRSGRPIEPFTLRALSVLLPPRALVENHALQPEPDRRTAAAGVRTLARGLRCGGALIDSRSARVAAPVAAAFRPIRRIGGTTGWYYADWMWRLRGWLDQLVGGVGTRRGRRDGESLKPGDVLDCWRVESVEPDRRLRLFAEMKLPGRAWLEFETLPDDDGSRITQTATFVPIGVLGVLYWYALWPVHELVFRGMLRNLARNAESLAAAASSMPPEA